jgi:flagellar hook-length control protein FliK
MLEGKTSSQEVEPGHNPASGKVPASGGKGVRVAAEPKAKLDPAVAIETATETPPPPPEPSATAPIPAAALVVMTAANLENVSTSAEEDDGRTAPPSLGPEEAPTEAASDEAATELAALPPPLPPSSRSDATAPAGAAAPAAAGTATASQAASGVALPGLAATASGNVAEAGNRADAPAPASPPPAAPPSPAAQIVTLLRASAGSDGQSMTIQLRPERLGTVEVRLDTDAKGKTTASFLADRPETLQLLKHDAPELVRALKEAGVDADAGSLGFGLRDTGSGNSGTAERGRTAQRLGAALAGDVDETPIAYRPPAANRLYDIHA